MFLDNKKVYLSGPIQYDTSNINWRIEPVKILKEKFKLDVFDPFSDPKQQWLPILKEAKEKRDYKTIATIAKDFVRKDLAVVDRSDFIIAYVPAKVPTIGTVHEIINSNNSKKPTLLVSNTNDIIDIPVWYYGFISLEFMFPNWESLYSYLEEVNDKKHINNDRWKFICNQI